MDLLIHAAGVYRDKNLFWVNHSPRPDAVGPKVREFLLNVTKWRPVAGRTPMRFVLDLCKELEIGSPRAVVEPLDAIVQVIGAVSLSTVTDADIRTEIGAARARLERLQALDAKTEPDDPVAAIVSKIREARLAGDHATAYRLASEALSE